jgi:hypothetical protein
MIAHGRTFADLGEHCRAVPEGPFDGSPAREYWDSSPFEAYMEFRRNDRALHPG